MTPLHATALFVAGLAAGTINTVVGSGSLITFPTLLALGYPPVTANVTNNLGVLPGAISGVVGYRRELVGQGRRLRRLVPAVVVGALAGALLLLRLPESAFAAIVPVLILLACVLVVVGPWVRGRLAARELVHEHGGPLLVVLIGVTAIYGGYFGAAQGVLLIALLGMFLADGLQRLNAVKNVLASVANAVAAVVFVTIAHVAWPAAAAVAAGSIIGGQVGAHLGRRLPPVVYRGIVLVVGLTAAVKLLIG